MENGLKCEGEFVNLLRERNNGSHRRAIAKFFEVIRYVSRSAATTTRNEA